MTRLVVIRASLATYHMLLTLPFISIRSIPSRDYELA